MYENMTYENILEDMLSRITSDVDKREGSIVYDALAPCAYQLAQAYFLLNGYSDLLFIDSSIGKYLDLKAVEYGISRKTANNAVRKIETTGAVDIGTRWGINNTTYEVIEILSENEYGAICEQSGEIGNTYSGTLENIDNVSGVLAMLTEIIISGEDEEADDNLRKRLYAKIQTPPSSGNAYHYRQWALEVTGVGDAKIFPLWNGPGTVKAVVIDSDKQPAPVAMIADVAKHIEDSRPIGAEVSVVSGVAKVINIKVKLNLVSGWSLQRVKDSFGEALRKYFQEIAFSLSYVSHAKIGTLLLGIDGVLDYSDLQLNDSNFNIELSEDEIPVVGSVELEVL